MNPERDSQDVPAAVAPVEVPYGTRMERRYLTVTLLRPGYGLVPREGKKVRRRWTTPWRIA